MKKAIFFLILATLLMTTIASAKQLTITPLNINIEYTLGQAQPSTQTINFVNNDNDTFTLTFSEEGTASDYFNISPLTYFYPNISGTSKALSVSFNIPSTTTPNLYTGNINYGTGEKIPVFINVKQAETTETCKISVPFTEYSKTIQRTTTSFTETYDFQISNKCIGGITLNSIKTSGSIATSRGDQPMQLTGGIPSGLYDAGKAGSYTLQFDVSNLEEGTYTTYVLMSGTNQDSQITKTIRYDLRVVGKISPVSNDTFGTLPTCTVGTNSLVANETYEFRCTNVNANLQVNVLPNEFFKGIKVNSESEVYSWTFKPLKIGETSLEVAFTYKGSPIGEIQKVPIKITTSPVSQASTEMTIEYLKEINTLKEGDNLSFLVKDAVSKNLITDSEAYLNGILLSNNQFTVHSGENYRLTVAKAGYNTIESNISIIKPRISINIPAIFEVGEIVTGGVSPPDITWTLNGGTYQSQTISLPFSNLPLGTYTLTATKSGYETASQNITVMPVTTIISNIPEKLKKDAVNSLQLSRDTEWEIQLQAPNGSIISITSGNTATINFIPSQAGIYTLYVRGNPLKQWEIKKGINLEWITWQRILIILVIATGAFIIYKQLKARNTSNNDEEDESNLGINLEGGDEEE